MDGNRTHQGHLNSALQTVLKTAWLPCTGVHRGSLQSDRPSQNSTIVRLCPSACAELAVFMAVTDRIDLSEPPVARGGTGQSSRAFQIFGAN